jgi:hypothetical protein
MGKGTSRKGRGSYRVLGLALEQVNPEKIGIWKAGWSPACCRLEVGERGCH